jgi:PAS domain-containing protein
MPPKDGGRWHLNLWNGTAWFSDWFYERLHWPAQVKRTRLDDLRPHLSAAAWQALLAAIRAHLEQQIPLDLQLRVQRLEGQVEWWRVQGGADRNAGGQPMNLTGTMHDVSPEAASADLSPR